MKLAPIIRKQIDSSPELRSKFEDELLDMINSRYWCGGNHINYVHPDEQKASEALFKEYQSRKIC